MKPEKTHRLTNIPARGLIPRETLIAYFRERADDCQTEIDGLVARYNARPDDSSLTDSDLKRMTEGWAEERRICRDAASWLQGGSDAR